MNRRSITFCGALVLLASFSLAGSPPTVVEKSRSSASPAEPLAAPPPEGVVGDFNAADQDNVTKAARANQAKKSADDPRKPEPPKIE